MFKYGLKWQELLLEQKANIYIQSVINDNSGQIHIFSSVSYSKLLLAQKNTRTCETDNVGGSGVMKEPTRIYGEIIYA